MDAKHSTLRHIQKLEELLDQLPLRSVIHSHNGLVEEGLTAWSERIALLGDPARRFWDHPAEILYDEVGVLLGATFVLLQAAVTETISIVLRIHELNGLMLNKSNALDLMVPRDKATGLSYPVIANAAANYYKHRFEWPDAWSEAKQKQQQTTIACLQSLGMSKQRDLADNLELAVNTITRDSKSTRNDLHLLVVEHWRESLSVYLRQEFRHV